MAFRAFIFFSLAFRVASSVWHSDPPSLFQFGVQNCISNLVSRVTILSQLWRSEPSSSSVWRLESHLQLGIQSHYLFSIMAFRAFIFFNLVFRDASSVWRSEPLSFFSLAFRTVSPAWRSESLSLLSYGVQGLHLLQFGVQSRISSLAFRAATSSQFGLQSHVFSLAFRATIHSQFGCSEPHLLFSVQSHYPFTVWHSEPSSYHSWAFVATFSTFRATFLAFRTTISLHLGVQSHHLITI